MKEIFGRFFQSFLMGVGIGSISQIFVDLARVEKAQALEKLEDIQQARLKNFKLMHDTPKFIKSSSFVPDDDIERGMVELLDTTIERGEVVVICPRTTSISAQVQLAARNQYNLHGNDPLKLRGVHYVDFKKFQPALTVAEFVRKELGDDYGVTNSLHELIPDPHAKDGHLLIILDHLEKLSGPRYTTGDLKDEADLDSLVFELAILSSNSSKKVLGVALVSDAEIARNLVRLNHGEKIRLL